MRPTFGPGRKRDTSIVQSTRRGRRSSRCSIPDVESPRRWPSFARRPPSCAPRWPRNITLDGHKPSHLGLRRLRREDHRWKYVLVRRSPYLNNLIEQRSPRDQGPVSTYARFQVPSDGSGHLGLDRGRSRIRKRQFKFGPGRWSFWSLKKQWDVALA